MKLFIFDITYKSEEFFLQNLYENLLNCLGNKDILTLNLKHDYKDGTLIVLIKKIPKNTSCLHIQNI